MSKVQKVTKNWASLNAGLKTLSLTEVETAISLEVGGRARHTVLSRLVARYGKLAAQDMSRLVARQLAKRR